MHRPNVIALTAYEIDPLLIGYLRKTLDLCRAVSEDVGIRFEGRIVAGDFLEAGADTLGGDLFAEGEKERFDCAILNPPYRKIGTSSRERRLRRAFAESTSLTLGTATGSGASVGMLEKAAGTGVRRWLAASISLILPGKGVER